MCILKTKQYIKDTKIKKYKIRMIKHICEAYILFK